MATIYDMLQKFKSFDIVTATAEIMKDNEQDVVELNRQQLLKGLTADNDVVGDYRSMGYALMKERMNPLAGFGNVDLKFTGEFYTGFTLIIDGNQYVIFSVNWKTNKLVKKYGDGIFGLNAESRQKLWSDIVRHKLIQKLASHTGCTIQ